MGACIKESLCEVSALVAEGLPMYKKRAFVQESLQKALLVAEGLSSQKGDKKSLREAFVVAAAEGLPL